MFKIKFGICQGQSRIISDCWEQAGFTHLKVNHKNNFINPETSTSVKKVENVGFYKVEEQTAPM
jgi:hypothetical protein